MPPHTEFRLDEAVADVYGDLRLAPVLRRLLRHTGRLTGSVAGSVSLIDADHGRYVKAAEYGASCRLGHSFPLDEGATGRAFGSRRPVVIPDYGQLRAGHLAAAHPARQGPAAAVPIWWRGEVIAVSVAFGPDAGALTTRGVDELEALTQSAAAAIVECGRRHPSLAAVIRRRFGDTPARAVVTEAGLVRPVSPEVARVAADLVAEAGRAAPTLHVAIVYRQEGVRVLVHAAPAPGAYDQLLRTAGGGVTVEQVHGWGVVVRADLPYAAPAAPAPFTPREAEVLELLRDGLTYREMARRLGLSAKTVEKHVAAILRKTGASNRTTAVVTALDNGWMGNLPHTAAYTKGS
ncbi:LuxR C-terminal-related transcriptional regulator [Actinoplanes friuliensis]|uniref:GAF sensor hybrid histidine kinase n=1 Tax=Actinoplanes friuliensis DSM 7358 TaxID=1246995 RepID=U5W0X4_9ACTN|nr:LuxR C-terminal-related transcriptional regulator [Actinoplanes friuliensis]AGZ42913.1 GAF sensor hybrid histidine kinase [Actinoplanes friuliensis DSM 7358]